MQKMADERLQRVLAGYAQREITQDYLSLYAEHGSAQRAFASIHERLDEEFLWMNYKARNGQPGHFNADNSRNLLDWIDEVRDLKRSFEKAGKAITVSPEYQRVLDGSAEWLVQSGGSAIPEGFTPVVVEKYAPVFSIEDTSVVLSTTVEAPLKMVGEGAFAIVYKFTDPTYGLTFAKKKLKRGSDPREVERFRREYDLMRSLDYPYILKVHRYDSTDDSYTMEFCESTLDKFISSKNNQESFGFGTRRRIALQFLYGLNYLHFKGHCHRDLSYNNILLRVYDAGAVTVKLSDFGLAKQKGSDFTQTWSEVRGTIVDPSIDSFKNFEPVNDIYVIGHVLSFIFKGVKHLLNDGSAIAKIVQKCSHSDPRLRYQNVKDVIHALETIEASPRGTPA